MNSHGGCDGYDGMEWFMANQLFWVLMMTMMMWMLWMFFLFSLFLLHLVAYFPRHHHNITLRDLIFPLHVLLRIVSNLTQKEEFKQTNKTQQLTTYGFWEDKGSEPKTKAQQTTAQIFKKKNLQNLNMKNGKKSFLVSRFKCFQCLTCYEDCNNNGQPAFAVI